MSGQSPQPDATLVVAFDDGVQCVHVVDSQGRTTQLLGREEALAFQRFRASERQAHAELVALADRQIGEPFRRDFSLQAMDAHRPPAVELKCLWLAVRAAADADLARLLARRSALAPVPLAELWARPGVGARSAAGFAAISAKALARAIDVATGPQPLVLQPDGSGEAA